MCIDYIFACDVPVSIVYFVCVVSACGVFVCVFFVCVTIHCAMYVVRGMMSLSLGVCTWMFSCCVSGVFGIGRCVVALFS